MGNNNITAGKKISNILFRVNELMNEHSQKTDEGFAKRLELRQGYIEDCFEYLGDEFENIPNSYPFKAMNRYPGESSILAHIPSSINGQLENVLLVAHHDCVPCSNGMIDNFSSVAVLLSLLDNFRKGFSIYNLDVLFTCCEEYGLKGATNFCASPRMKKYKAIFILDTCGIGDSVYICPSHFDLPDTGIGDLGISFMENSGGILTDSVPVCESSVFRKYCDKVYLICSGFPSTLSRKIYGFDIYRYPAMLVMDYIHGGSKDDINNINIGNLERIYKGLADALFAR